MVSQNKGALLFLTMLLLLTPQAQTLFQWSRPPAIRSSSTVTTTMSDGAFTTKCPNQYFGDPRWCKISSIQQRTSKNNSLRGGFVRLHRKERNLVLRFTCLVGITCKFCSPS